MSFRDPWWLFALAACVPIVWWQRRMGRASLRFPTVEGLHPFAGRRVSWHELPTALRLACVLLTIVALARPQQGLEASRLRAEGIDIMLVVDVSTSMLAEDFELGGQRRNRLAVVKDVIKSFIAQRPNDRIGVVIFAGRAYTQAPLTLDHGWLLDQIERLEIGAIEDGTAIGSGIATGLNRLRDSKAKSRIMVLLTDGVNNAGTITPEAAAQLAKAVGVRIYAVGAGTKGAAPYPTKDLFGRKVYQAVKIEVDDEGLTRVAQTTGGHYFRATDTDSLRKTYAQIDRMEKTTLEQPVYQDYKEWYAWLLVLAIGLLLVELALGHTWLRVLP